MGVRYQHLLSTVRSPRRVILPENYNFSLCQIGVSLRKARSATCHKDNGYQHEREPDTALTVILLRDFHLRAMESCQATDFP